MNVRVLGEAKLRRYVPLAYRSGQAKVLFPRYALSLPVADDPDLAMEQVAAKIKKDPRFRARYAGWRFMAVEYGNSLAISEDGSKITRCD